MINSKKAITLLLLAASAISSNAKVDISRLTIEGRETAIGLDVEQPRFGWQIMSDKRNVKQKAYRIIVASTMDRLSKDDGDVWDSGFMATDCSQWIALPKDKRLKAGKEYFWKVMVKTNKGETAWSQAAKWSTGLLTDSNWKGYWIGTDSMMPWDKAKRHSRLSARYLRKCFTTKHQPIRRAMIYISGLGYYTLNINGGRVGNDVLTPLPTEYAKTIAYDAYDVTSMLKEHNTIGVTLEGGHYFAQTQDYQTNVRTTYGQPCLLANLLIEYADGNTETIATDSTWRICANGPVRYANEYDGELYNANLALTGWDTPQYDDSNWNNAQMMKAPEGKLHGALAPNMHIYATERPLSVRNIDGRYIIDFGTNNAGRIHLRMPNTTKGDTIRIRHAELLQKGDSSLYVANLRSAEATALYVADGKEMDWSPEFTFYGFRYAEIIGVDDLSAADITRELIADRMDDANTEFSINDINNNDILNRIVANARRGIRSNYKGMPIDCPQRDERMPWLGDRTTGCLGESYVVDNHALYSKWVKDICDGQLPDGRISDVTPAYWRLYNTNITWPAALPFACDMLYRQYGDIKPFADSYESIKRFLMMIRKENYKDGLVPYDRYGDWCVPPESPKLVHSKDPSRKTDGQLISSAYYYYLCQMMAKYGKILGYTNDVDYFKAESDTSLNAINHKYLKNYVYP